MVGELDLETVRDFATALLIGTLLGIERERHKQADGDVSVGGTAHLHSHRSTGGDRRLADEAARLPVDPGAVVLATLVAVAASYVRATRVQPQELGITTELAAIAICLLGAMVMLGQREIAVALAVAIAAVLAYKKPLHEVVSRLDAEDVYAGVRLLAATFHRPATAPRPRNRSLGRAEPAEALAAGVADLRAVAGGLCRGAPAGPESRHTAHRTHRRARLLDRSHAVVCQAEPREGSFGRRAGVRLRHPDLLERDVLCVSSSWC
jgi:hypothetical protein